MYKFTFQYFYINYKINRTTFSFNLGITNIREVYNKSTNIRFVDSIFFKAFFNYPQDLRFSSILN